MFNANFKNIIYSRSGAVYGEGVIAMYNDKYFSISDLAVTGKEFNRSDYPFMDILGNDWECGHLLGKQLGGDNKAHNLLPMTRKSNAAFRDQMECRVRDVLENLGVITAQLNMGSNLMVCSVKYEVNIVAGSEITVNGLNIPGRFRARLSIVDYKGMDLPAETLQISKHLSDNGLTVPLDLMFDVDMG